MTPTIRIASDKSDDNPAGFVVINRADFDPAKHEPFDDAARAALAGAVASGERIPTVEELLAARDQLLEREAELAAEKARVEDRANANEVEARRLSEEAAKQAEAAAAQLAQKAEDKPAKARKADDPVKAE